LLCGISSAAAEDAYIKREGGRWHCNSKTMERVIALEDGKLLLTSLRDKTTGRELIAPEASFEEFFFQAGNDRQPLSGASGGWKLVHDDVRQLGRGELQLDLMLQRDSLVVVKSYVVYPESSIVREWLTIKNAGTSPVLISSPGFLCETLRIGDPEQLDFHWMSGAENQPGCWLMKTEKLAAEAPRAFDSYDPFPGYNPNCPGDGINAKVLLNEKQVWPSEGWKRSYNIAVTAPVDFAAEVAAGDRLVFLVNMNGNIGFDTTAFDPIIEYADGERHTASEEFSDKQGQSGWRYQYVEGNKYVDLVYYPTPKQWRKAQDNATGTPFVSAGEQHPDVDQDAARVWTAPKAGRVRVTASLCNTGNKPAAGSYGMRMGSSAYAPWYALFAKDTRIGAVIGWDYFGHWASSFRRDASGNVSVELKVAGHKQTLAPGESLATPAAFVGLFHDDLDDAGNEVLDWQYRYLWDYTRDEWFPAIRVLGYWMKGTSCGDPAKGWFGGGGDKESTFRKVFRVADLMRRIGGDVYHRDWGWWDLAGDWNGPDFRVTGDYLRKSNMGQLIYAFLYTVDWQSKVAREHSDWVIRDKDRLDVRVGGTLDLSKPEVVEFMKGQLDDFHRRWGDFEWRNDSYPTAPRDGDDTPLLGQDAGLREVIRSFLDKHPGSAFQGVNGGGNEAGYDYARYSSTISFSDGAVGVIRNYYASLMLPPDKTSDIPDIWNPDNYDKATWRGLLCINFDMTGDTWDPVKLEGLRELIDIYHYLHREKVVGRWVRVYRPSVLGDDPTMYFQRLSGDHLRGIIIPKRPAPGAVTIVPKGLLPGETYTVSFHESGDLVKRTGRDLMENGVKIEKMPPGELIYLNLPLHPGSKLDKTPPSPPSDAKKHPAENMGYPGVEIVWKAGADDNWVSYYDIFREGAVIDRVAKGLYYFDHSAGADMAAKYEVRTVDGAGNVSTAVAGDGPAGKRATILDDADDSALKYSGAWQRQTGLQPAHTGTLATSSEPNATVSFAFEGKRVLWFSKLGEKAGRAAVSIDDGPAETVDTYSADDIWGVCVYRKDFPAAGRHTIKTTVLGQRDPKSKGNDVSIDGFRVEP
jgi:hypothetical protein